MAWAENYIHKLETQKFIKFRPRGNSMVPKIKSGQLVTVLSLKIKPTQLILGDIVLCKVKGKQYLHLISAIDIKPNNVRYQISNNKGKINGYASAVYGLLLKVEN